MKPMLSIILPTYNGGDRIGRAILSVQNQTFHDWELIVIIDGATDATFERVSKIAQQDRRIIIIQNTHNQGIQKTLNEGLEKSQGKYIARIDDDDVWIDKNKLQKQYDFLNKNSEYGIVGTGIILVDKNRRDIGKYFFPENDQDIRKKILGQNCFAHPTVLLRKSIIDQVGGYSEQKKHKHIEDHELWLRIGMVSKFKNIPEYTTAYQVDHTSLSGKNKALQLKRRFMLCSEYRKNYPHFFINIVKITFVYFGYISVGWLFVRSTKVRGRVTEFYKKIF
jgi:glycosyltransferase involved in cell wall biosynthesis